MQKRACRSLRLDDSRLRALLADGRQGSSSAVGVLLENCRDYLLLVANKSMPGDVRQKVAASDLVQETLAEGYQAFGGFAGTTPEEWLGWLARILQHNIGDAIRRYREAEKRDVRREVSLDDDDSIRQIHEQFVVSDESIGQQVIRAEQRQVVSEALLRLPDNYRRAIQLRNLDYRSFPEIAAAMHISPAAAQKLWQRAIKRLAGELGAANGTDQRQA